MKMRIQTSIVALSFSLAATAALAQSYSVIDLGVDVAPKDINNYGVIVGAMNTDVYPSTAFVRNPEDGNLVISGATVAYAINDNGLIAGSTLMGAFVADSNGIIHDWNEQGAWGINAYGYISGNKAGNNPYRTTSIPYDPAVYEGNKWTVMGIADVYPRGTRPGVYADIYRLLDINDAGYTVGSKSRYGLAGSSAILIEPPFSDVKDATDVSYLPTPFGGSATAINNGNQVVGTSGNDSRSDTYAHAFLYDFYTGILTDLGTLMNADGEYGLRSSAADINDRGQVVGSSWLVSANTSLYDPSQYHAFLWENGMMSDLNDLIPAGSDWVLTAATAINENGDIVGTGLRSDGVSHGFLLTSSDLPPPPVVDNLPPVAVADADPVRGKAPLQVAFSAARSTDPEDSVLTYLWDFGYGGEMSTEQNPVHLYMDPGTYTVALTVTDDQGQTDTVELEIRVRKAGGKK